MRQAGCSVEIHDDHFPPDAQDADWLPVIGARSWVVLTKDQHIRTRQSELVALLSAGVAAFVLSGGDFTGPEMAATFVRALPRMRRMLVGQRRPFIARVSAGGSLSLIVKSVPRWLQKELRRRRS